ncbi:MAG: hypothetical protein OEO83_16790 [Alphaproteobacteria bacterium]|nr:hypothetical protein [Alphaproteobacteria bacterium]
MRFQKLTMIGAVIGVSLLAGACTERAIELWEQPHEAEGLGLGDVTRQNMAQHIVNPEPAKPTANESAVAGERVGLGVTRYNQGKTIQPKSTQIGGGGGK